MGETDLVLIIEDIMPKAPIHFLIIPKKHIVSMAYLEDEDISFIGAIALAARDVAQTLPQDSRDFTLVSNSGEKAGQTVFHLHWHFLSGKQIL